MEGLEGLDSNRWRGKQTAPVIGVSASLVRASLGSRNARRHRRGSNDERVLLGVSTNFPVLSPAAKWLPSVRFVTKVQLPNLYFRNLWKLAISAHNALKPTTEPGRRGWREQGFLLPALCFRARPQTPTKWPAHECERQVLSHSSTGGLVAHSAWELQYLRYAPVGSGYAWAAAGEPSSYPTPRTVWIRCGERSPSTFLRR